MNNQPLNMNWWNSSELISSFGTLFQILVAFFGLLSLIFGIRSSQLKDEQQQRLKLDIANAQKEAAIAVEKTAEFEKEAAIANLELEKLKERQAPWVLTTDQVKILKEHLHIAPKGSVEFSFIVSDSERAGKFARYLEKVFKESGHDTDPSIGMFSSPSNPEGIGVFYIDGVNYERAERYNQIFLSVGLKSYLVKRDLKKNPIKRKTSDSVGIKVYHKPKR